METLELVDVRRRLAVELLSKNSKSNNNSTSDVSLKYEASFSRTFNVRDFSTYPDVLEFQKNIDLIKECGVENPYFRVSESITDNCITIASQKYLSFSSYNYLGYSGEFSVREAAKNAIDKYGTSPSASRLVSGEKPVHRALEDAVAKFLGTESALVFASGHAANVTVIGHFFNSQDLIIYDELSHNSLLEGCVLSGARRISFPHNDVKRCREIIEENINKYQKIVVAIEGAYSMDGDISPLDEFVLLRKKFPILLYVDEAHSLGTVGETGRGVGEYFNINSDDVDFWMGTLSKTLASNGGYIAGKRALIDYLKYTTPGFVYSAGITPANAAAALAGLALLQAGCGEVKKIQENSDLFRSLASAAGLNIGLSKDTPIVPIIVGSATLAIRLADTLFDMGICVHPVFYPAVPLDEARLRFFITSQHTEENLRYAVDKLVEAIA